MADPDAPPAMFVISLGPMCRILAAKPDHFPHPAPWPAVRLTVEAVAISGGTQDIGGDCNAREVIEAIARFSGLKVTIHE